MWFAVLSFTWAVMLCAGSQGSQAAELPAVLVINTVEVATAAQPVNQPHQRTDVDADGSTKAYMAEQLPLASSESRTPLRQADAAGRLQPSFWQHCCTLLHHQMAMVLGGSIMHSHASTQAHMMDKASAMRPAARRLLAQQMRPPGGSQQYSVLGSLGAVPLLAAVVLMVAGPFRWLKRKQDGTAGSCMADSSCGSDEGVPMMVDAAVSLVEEDECCKPSPRGLGEGIEDAPAAAAKPLVGGSRGWQLSASSTSPLAAHVGQQQVRLGLLVGAGSTSHVYRGAWANTDVAVKLIPFDASTLSNPAQQLQQLTTLNHPNLVRTYCGVIYTRQGPTPAAASACQQQHSGLADSGQQLEGGQDAPKAQGSSSGRDQEQPQQLFVLTGSSPPALGLQGGLVSPTSSMGSVMTPVGFSAGAFRVSDSSGMVVSPTAGLQQQRPGRASASSLAAEENEAEAWLVQEWCNLGTLHSVALEWQIAGDGDLQMFERLSLLVDAARGLKYLHSKDIIHGDLNAHNIMISRSSDSPVRMTAKVTDMGLSSAIKHGSNSDSAKSVRMLSHVAPEVQRHGRAGPESDIYSFGILMWEVFTGQQAYRKLLDAEHLYEAMVIQNLRPKIPEGMPADYQLLMERCWASDTADRPSVDKLVGCLSVMAAERQRRLNPNATLPSSATPAAAAAVAARGTWPRLSPLAYTHSCDQATLQMLVQQQAAQQQQLGGSSIWRQGSGGMSLPKQSSMGRLPLVLPGPGLIQHKSCPAATFQSLLRSNSLLPRSSGDSDASESEQMEHADAVFAELQEEEEMLQQLRATSHTQSGPGSAPVLHSSQPHQRYSDGLDLGMAGIDDAHTWHI